MGSTLRVLAGSSEATQVRILWLAPDDAPVFVACVVIDLNHVRVEGVVAILARLGHPVVLASHDIEVVGLVPGTIEGTENDVAVVDGAAGLRQTNASDTAAICEPTTALDVHDLSDVGHGVRLTRMAFSCEGSEA
jgi:hypothetical protein